MTRSPHFHQDQMSSSGREDNAISWILPGMNQKLTRLLYRRPLIFWPHRLQRENLVRTAFQHGTSLKMIRFEARVALASLHLEQQSNLWELEEKLLQIANSFLEDLNLEGPWSKHSPFKAKTNHGFYPMRRKRYDLISLHWISLIRTRSRFPAPSKIQSSSVRLREAKISSQTQSSTWMKSQCILVLLMLEPHRSLASIILGIHGLIARPDRLEIM